MIEKGMGRIEKELEITRFLRAIMQFRIAMSFLFTRTERFLIRHNKKFVIDSDNASEHS